MKRFSDISVIVSNDACFLLTLVSPPSTCALQPNLKGTRVIHIQSVHPIQHMYATPSHNGFDRAHRHDGILKYEHH